MSEQQLKLDEGLRLKPYRCTTGKLTIGYGRNLEDRGISPEEAEFLFQNDLKSVESDLDRAFPWWRGLHENAQWFLRNLCFNLGISGLRKWKETLRLLEARQYKAAAKQFRTNRRYFSQVGPRAERLAKSLEGVV